MAVRSVPAGDGRRQPVNMKMPPELKGRLEAAASGAGRTLSNEIETRLVASFATGAPVQGGWHGKMLAAFGRVLRDAEAYSSQKLDDPDGGRARTMARRAMTELVRTFFGDDAGEADGFVSGEREDGTPAIENFDFSRGLALAALRNEALLVPSNEHPGLLTFAPQLLAINNPHKKR